jgi:hypothetical protein
MRKSPFLWLILVFFIVFIPPPTLLDADALSSSSGDGTIYTLALIFSILAGGACLIGLCLIAFFRKD